MDALASIKRDTVCPFGRGARDLEQQVLSASDKYWLGSRVVFEMMSTREVADMYNLNIRRVQRYAEAYRNNTFLKSVEGRPRSVDEDGYERVKRKAAENDHCMKTPELRKMIHDEAMISAEIRGIPITERKYPSRSTLWRIEQKVAAKSGVAEETTNARAQATRDVRNAVSFAAMNALMVPLIPPQLIANIDATQFTVGNSSKGKVVVKYFQDENGKRPKSLKTLPDEAHGLVAYFIKYYLLMFADGTQGTPVFVVANDNLKPLDFDVHEVLGLGIGTDFGSKAFVVFCKTRCCNVPFYRWLNDEVIIPCIQKKKECFAFEPDAPTWFQLDGEPVQIAMYNEEAVTTALDEKGIVVGKPPASTTEITQPCDNGNCFKGPKTRLKYVNAKDIADNDYMKKKLLDVVKDHQERMKILFNSAHKKLFAEGMLRVHYALQNSMRQYMIKESFERCGVFPLNVRKILSNCKEPIGDRDLFHIENELPSLVDKLGRNGELFDSDFDDSGIANNIGSEKDQYVIHRRRSVILTNKLLIRRELAKKEQAADKAAQAKAKKEERAAKRRRKAEEERKKMEADTLIRFEGMTTVHETVVFSEDDEEDEDDADNYNLWNLASNIIPF